MAVSPRLGFKKQAARRSALLLACLLMATGTTSYAAPKTAVHTIVIEAMQYSPASLDVKPGDTVIWNNKDAFPHTATANQGGFDSGTIQSGGSWKFIAKKRGTFPYFCTLHPTMKAQLVVK